MLLVSVTKDIDTKNKNNNGKTPLAITSEKGYKPIIDELIRREANDDSVMIFDTNV